MDELTMDELREGSRLREEKGPMTQKAQKDSAEKAIRDIIKE